MVLTLCAGIATAQLPVPPSSQFDVTGFLQEATVDNPADAHSGGKLKVNNHVITVPRETIVILPANALSWQELFAKAPAPWGIPGNLGVTTATATTGMAFADCANNTSPCTAPPLTTYEVHVIGNRVPNAVGGDQYIAGMIDIAQNGLNSGAGFINYIDYTIGEMRVGGTMGDPNSGARVRINDPMGRYGRNTTSPDVRFTVDPDNPTVSAGTGYPMCLPRTAPVLSAAGLPNQTTDLLCPEENRPVSGIDVISGLTSYNPSFTTANLTSTCLGTCVPAPAGTFPDSTLQAPFEVGDYIFFSGALMKDPPAGGFVGSDGPTVGPMPAAALTYTSADTVENNIAIYTFPGSNPAYVTIEVGLIGTGGLTVLGAGEAAIRTRFEGMTTDYSRGIHIYGIDYDPLTGQTTDRDWGTVGVDPGPAGGVGAVQGRWRFRPPCLDFGTIPTKPDKQCVYGPTGNFLPPTREFRAVVEGLQSQNPANAAAIPVANGLFYGQYHAPLDEYIFPENIPGSPIVPNNFEAIPFLAQGGYSSSGIPDGKSILGGQLSPWPGASAPAPACAPAQAVAGGPYTVASTGSITLAGEATGSGPFTYQWSVASGTLSNATIANPVYTAPAVAAQTDIAATLTVTGACGTSSSNTTITVNAAAAPTVNHIAPITVFSGTPVQLAASATDPAGLQVQFQFTQLVNGATIVLNPNPSASTALVNPGVTANGPRFTLALPLGALGQTLSFQVVATNSAGAVSAPEFFTVTVNPTPDIITITTAQYRTGKQRLDFTVTDSVISPNVVLSLQPYLTEQGTMFDPASVGGQSLTNTGGGIYTMTLVGAPRPACNLGGAYATPCAARPFIVKSNLGGQSAPTALTNIRQ